MEQYKYDKNELKENLSIEQIFELVAELGGEPQMQPGSFFTARTICHNVTGEGSHKLYYYDNTKLFKCYTDCGTSFDIFELVHKVKNINGHRISYYTREGLATREWQLPDAIEFVAVYFGYSAKTFEFEIEQERLPDWDIFNVYEKISLAHEQQEKIVELKIYEDEILKHLPKPRIKPWLDEGISKEVMDARGIAYDPKNHGIIIPHYNPNNELIGIRIRTLVKENEVYGKYRPAILNGQMYNHPLGFNLYNLNNSKDNIKIMKKAIVFEGEKSPLLYASYFGLDNDITCASCGSALISYQVKLLLEAGAEEIIIAYDKQFKKIGDEEWQKWTKNLTNIHTKYGAYAQISYMFDKEDLLGYKDSPIDRGPDIFMKLFKERVTL